MGEVPLIGALDLFELVAIALLVASNSWLTFRSFPATLTTRQRRVEAISAELASKVGEIVDERAIWKAQGERLAEEVSTYLDQIERKRSSTAASASRIESAKHNGGQVKVADMDRQQQIEFARRQLGG